MVDDDDERGMMVWLIVNDEKSETGKWKYHDVRSDMDRCRYEKWSQEKRDFESLKLWYRWCKIVFMDGSEVTDEVRDKVRKEKSWSEDVGLEIVTGNVMEIEKNGKECS